MTKEEFYQKAINHWKASEELWRQLFLLAVASKNHVRVNRYYSKYIQAQIKAERFEEKLNK